MKRNRKVAIDYVDKTDVYLVTELEMKMLIVLTEM